MITVEALRNYIGSPTSDDEFLAECIEAGEALVDTYVGEAVIPDALLDQVYLMVSGELYHRRNAPNGIAQFASFDGAPMRIAKDPLNGVYPILNRYVEVAL